jgi:arsenate reductase-like glutaredoxin family protein
MEENSSLETNNCATCQAVSRLLENLKVHYRILKTTEFILSRLIQ